MKRKQIFALMLLLAVTTFGFAQRGPDRLDRMKTELDLTEAQTQRLTEINEQFKKQRESLRVKEFGSEEDRRNAHRTLRQKHRDAIRSVLTPEQQTRARALRQQHRDERKAKVNSPEGKAKRAEVRAYKEKNVLPVLRVQRAKLTVAPEDEILLQQLRSTMEQRKAAREKLRNATPEERQAAREQHRQRDGAERETAHKLVEKYAFQIDALMKEIEPQRRQWKTDIRNILGEDRPARGEGHHRGQHHEGASDDGKHPDGDRHGHKGHRGKDHMGALKFLLLEAK